MKAARPGAAFALAVLAVASTVVPAQAQSGEALGVAPSRILVAGAQPGETYVRTVTLQHQFDSPGTIRVEADGPEGSWVRTEPASPFPVPPRTNRAVTVHLAIPANASPGDHNTTLRFVREATQAPSGSGASVEVSAGIHLDIGVGGEPVERIAYLSARVEDAAQGSPVRAFVLARNDGNVRGTAQAEGQVIPFADDAPALANATGSLVLLPGEEVEVPLQFTAALAPGQYRARLLADGFAQTLPFKVTPPGESAPDGVLRAILHVPRATAGRPVDIVFWFENTGPVGIAEAAAHVRIHDGGLDAPVLVRLESEPAAVAVGRSVNLTITWTPPEPGTYTLAGHVSYDGYVTLPNENLLNAVPGGSPFPWWILILLLCAATAAVAGAWAWRRRRDRLARQGESPPAPGRRR